MYVSVYVYLTSLMSPSELPWNRLHCDDTASKADWHTQTTLPLSKASTGCVHVESDRQFLFLVPDSINHLERGFPWSLLSAQADTTTSGWQGLEWHRDTLIRHTRVLFENPLFYLLNDISIVLYVICTNQICGMGYTIIIFRDKKSVAERFIFWTIVQSAPSELGDPFI